MVHPDPLTLDGVFDFFFWAAATVHPRYDGRHDWSSTMLLGRLAARSVERRPGDDGRSACSTG